MAHALSRCRQHNTKMKTCSAFLILLTATAWSSEASQDSHGAAFFDQSQLPETAPPVASQGAPIEIAPPEASAKKSPPANVHANPSIEDTNAGARALSLGNIESIKQAAEESRPEIEQIIKEIQERNASNGNTARGFHNMSIIAGQAVFQPTEISAALKALLADGVFAAERSGEFRFSNGRSEGDNPTDQRKPDVRGVAFFFGGQGLTLTNQQTQILPTGVDFLRFFNELGKTKGFADALTLLPRWVQTLGAGKLWHALLKLIVGAQPITDLMRTQYWGSAIVVGSAPNGDVYIARPTLIPNLGRSATNSFGRLLEGRRNSWPFRSPDYLRKSAIDQLSVEDVTFTLALQFYQDEELTPLHADGDKPWNTPVIEIGEIVFPRQTIESALERKIEECGSFGPQVVDERVATPAIGVGQFQEQRDIAYKASADRRASTSATPCNPNH